MMKRAISLLLCLVMVLSFAAPTAQASGSDDIYVSDGDLDNIVIGDNVQLDNVVIDGHTVTTPSEQVTETTEPATSPVFAEMEPTVPAEDGCKCEDLASAVDHAGVCVIKAYYQEICAATAEELYAQWAGFTAEEQAYMLQYLKAELPIKHNELQALLSAPTGSDSETLVDGTTVSVERIPQDGSVTVTEAADAVKDIVDTYVAENVENATELFSYDVSVQDGEGADWQPDGTVKMELEMPGVKLHKYSKVYVVHVDDNGVATTIEAEVTENGKIAFETPGFSTFAGFTVDFEFEGVEFSIPGLTSIKLSEIFDQLKMPLYVEDVANVEFTNYDLISVEKQADGDWLLTSLKAFSTTEALTLTMNDGTVYEITVTDAAYPVLTIGSGTTNLDGNANGAEDWYLTDAPVNRQLDDSHTEDYDITIDGTNATTSKNFEIVLQRNADSGDGRILYLDLHSIFIKGGANLTFRLGATITPANTDKVVVRQVRGRAGNSSSGAWTWGELFYVTEGSLTIGVTRSDQAGIRVQFDVDTENLASDADAKAFVSLRSGATSFTAKQCDFINAHTSAIMCRASAMTSFKMTDCSFGETDSSHVSTKACYNAGQGGAIYIHETVEDGNTTKTSITNLTLTNVRFNATQAKSGRGGAMIIRSDVNALSLTNCTFTNTTATSHGGAMNIGNNDAAVTIGSATFTGCTFTNTEATGNRGGAIRMVANCGPFTISDCDFIGCTAGGHGGAISLQGTVGNFTVENGSTFQNCTGGYRGGAIGVNNSQIGDITLSGSSFTGNTGGSLGGAVHFGLADGTVPITAGAVSVTGCTFTNNIANGGIGGGLCLTDGSYESVTVSTSTFTNCDSVVYGGAIAMKSMSDSSADTKPFSVTGAVQILGCTFTNCDAGGLIPQSWDHDGDATTENSTTWDHDEDSTTPEITRLNGTGGGGAIAIGGAVGTSITIQGTDANTYSTFTNCTTWNNGGAIILLGEVVTPKTTLQYLNMDGCRARDAGNAVHVSNVIIDSLDMKYCTVQNCSYFTDEFVIDIPADYASLGTAVYKSYDASGTFRSIGNTTCQAVIENCVFLNNESYENGGGIYWNANNIRNGAAGTTITPSLTLNNTDFIGNHAGRDGGGVYCEATVDINGCEFTENSAALRGGAIAQQVYSNEARMLGATEGEATNLILDNYTLIYNNTAVNGGGISITTAATVSVPDGTNVIYPVKFALGGASVYNNYATQNGGGIYYSTPKYDDELLQREVDNFQKEILINQGLIYGNIAGYYDETDPEAVCLGGSGGGIYMNSNQVNTADNLPDTDTVGTGYSKVSVTEGSIYSNQATEGNGGGVYLTGVNALCTVSGGYIGVRIEETAGETEGEIVQTVVAAANTATVKTVTDDSGTTSVSGGNGGGIAIYGGARIEMTGGIISYNEAYVGGGIAVRDGSSMFSGKAADGTSGTVSYNKATSAGGGIAVHDAGSTMTINEGTVSYNTADYGGGISVMSCGDKSTIGTANEVWGMIFNDGTISENLSSTLGGGICLSGNSTMKLTGGDITLNKAATKNETENEDGTVTVSYTYSSGQEGGGIAVCQGSQMDIYGGTVKANNAADGGGLVVRGSSTLNMYKTTDTTAKAGTISDNVTNNRGGGIYCLGSTVNLYGGLMSANKSLYGAGGFFDGSSTVLIDGASVENNVATWQGGGLFFRTATVTIDDGIISNNEAASNGGGIRVDGAGGVTINGGTISENKSGEGAGLWIKNIMSAPTVTIYGGTISKNVATGSGGGIFVHGNAKDGTELTMYGGTVSDNTAGQRGGGVCADSWATVLLSKYTKDGAVTRPQVTRNTGARGGGIYVCYGADLTVDEGFITFNHAKGTSSETTALNLNDKLYGIGGGICVVDGVSDSNPATFTLKGENMAIYGNLADFGADDVFANSNKTTLTIPQVSTMNLAGYQFKPEAWFEDYPIDDSAYTSGLNLGGEKGITNGNVYRYRGSSSGHRVLISEANITSQVNVANTYVCMTLGIPAAVDDTVVVDWGLPVKINVIDNDVILSADELKESGTLGSTAPTVDNQEKIFENNGVIYGGLDSNFAASTLKLTNLNHGVASLDRTNGYVSYQMNSNDMAMASEDTFYYAVYHEVPTSEGTEATGYYYYGKVQVIPATTIYFEDNFGTSISYTGTWTDTSTTKDLTDLTNAQAQDRVGESDDVDLDTDNIYGYDGAYASMTTWSMGSAKKTTVSEGVDATATFTFTGTGFDVISFCSDKTGMIMVSIYQGDAVSGEAYETLMVDTYYEQGYNRYQVPVIKRTGLDYGTWTVEIYVAWSWWADQGQYDYGSWDFYLDAIRIYDPANNGASSDTVRNAYLQDNECWPTYQELRNMFLTQSELSDEPLDGVLFIDMNQKPTITEYQNYGPNNEVYLSKGQSIAFTLNELNYANKAFSSEAFTDTEVAAIHIAMRGLTGAGKVTVSAADGSSVTVDLSTTDLYYDITSMKNQVVTIANAGSTPISITTVKVTHTGDPGTQANLTNLFTADLYTAEMALAMVSGETTAAPVLTPKYPTLSFEGEIRYNVYFAVENLGDLTAADLGLVTFTTEDTDGTLDTASDVITGAVASDDLYVVSTNGIAAKNLGDTLYFKVFAKHADGSYVYSDLYSYSAVQYANSILNYSESDAHKALVVAMLNYGAAAQTFFGHNTDSLMNKDLTAGQLALVNGFSADDLNSVGTVDETKVGRFTANGGFSSKYPTVSFEGAFQINYYFVPSNAVDGDMTLYIWNEDTYNGAAELTADNADSAVTMTLTDGAYTAVSPEIAAKELDKTLYVAAVYESNGTTYCTGVLPYSLASYCQEHAANTESGMNAFANAAAIYGCAAKAFFGI